MLHLSRALHWAGRGQGDASGSSFLVSWQREVGPSRISTGRVLHHYATRFHSPPVNAASLVAWSFRSVRAAVCERHREGDGECCGRDRLLVVGGETKKAGKRRRPLCSSRLPRSLRPPCPPGPLTPLSPACTEQNGGRSHLSPNTRGRSAKPYYLPVLLPIASFFLAPLSLPYPPPATSATGAGRRW